MKNSRPRTRWQPPGVDLVKINIDTSKFIVVKQTPTHPPRRLSGDTGGSQQPRRRTPSSSPPFPPPSPEDAAGLSPCGGRRWRGALVAWMWRLSVGEARAPWLLCVMALTRWASAGVSPRRVGCGWRPPSSPTDLGVLLAFDFGLAPGGSLSDPVAAARQICRLRPDPALPRWWEAVPAWCSGLVAVFCWAVRLGLRLRSFGLGGWPWQVSGWCGSPPPGSGVARRVCGCVVVQREVGARSAGSRRL
jgi:hypothetical protein